jgi:hypothetical protein
MYTIVIVFVVIFCCLTLVAFLMGLCCLNCFRTTRTMAHYDMGLTVTYTALNVYVILYSGVQCPEKFSENSEE